MTDRSSRPWIAILVTTVALGVTSGRLRGNLPEQSAQLPRSLTFLPFIVAWVMGAVVLWMHVAYDLRSVLLQRHATQASRAGRTQIEEREDQNV